MYTRFPLSLRNVEDLLHERGIDVSDDTIRFWWDRFGPIFASELRKRRIGGMWSDRWPRHLDEVFVKINGETHCLWRALEHEREVLESFLIKTRDKKAALKFMRKAMRRHGRPKILVAASVHATVYNHFNQERGLSSRTIFNAKRATDLTEWRGLCAKKRIA